jgi:hypothetical protein
MQPYSYVPYPNPNGASMPNRYMVPANYQQRSPPFDRYAGVPPVVRPTHYVPVPVRYPPGYIQRYPAPGLPPQPMPTMIPVLGPPRPQYGNQSHPLQPPQAYYYNPNGSTEGHSEMPLNSNPSTSATKKSGKEYKNKPFTDNNDMNELLKQKGTKVKISKIYRITKQKPERQDNESTDDEYEPVSLESARPRTIQQLPPPPPSVYVQRAPSASSTGSHCSTCSNCSCGECRSRGQGHTYDDCPECRAEREQAQAKQYKRK